jgi:sulfoxide reductase heme-binding subunit YedZ
VAGVVHYYWLVKSDITRPVFYAAIVGLLLAYRVAIKLAGILRAKSSAKSPASVAVKETVLTLPG